MSERSTKQSSAGRRQSNMELLRIVAMFLIVLFHCALKSDFTFNEPTPNTLAVKGFWMFGELGVNLFTLVSGYFLIKGSFKSERLIRLLCQVLFYWALTIVVALNMGLLNIESLKAGILLFFPNITGRYWYVTAYIIIYIFSPWINSFLTDLSRKRYIYLLLAALVIWSVIPTFFGALSGQVEGMLFYSRLIWLTIMYAFGAYIRLASPAFFRNIRKPLLLSLVSFSLMIVSVVLIADHPKFFSRLGITEWAYFWPPNTILMWLLSLGVFGLFLNLKIQYNRPINLIATTTLGVYLFHDGVLWEYIWRVVVHAAQYQQEIWLILYIVGAAVLVFLVGMLVDFARQMIEHFTLIKLFKSKFWLHVKQSFGGSISKFVDRMIGQ